MLTSHVQERVNAREGSNASGTCKVITSPLSSCLLWGTLLLFWYASRDMTTAAAKSLSATSQNVSEGRCHGCEEMVLPGTALAQNKMSWSLKHQAVSPEEFLYRIEVCHVSQRGSLGMPALGFW